jgi:hypothetical protein
MFWSKGTDDINLRLVPLYIAVSNYAFRNWKLTKNQSVLGKKSKIIITVFIIISVLISISLPPYISYNMRTLKFVCTEKQRKFLYKVPVERKIADAGNQIKDNIKINYENFEMKLPAKKIEEKCGPNDSNFKNTTILIEKGGRLIDIMIPSNHLPKDKNGKEPLFEKYNRMLYMTPDKINLLKDSKDQYMEKIKLLLVKSFEEFYVGSGSIYKFETSNIRGFQFVNPERIKKAKHIKVEIFDNNDHQYELTFFGFSQGEIDYVLSSTRVNEMASGPAKETIKGIRVKNCIFMDRTSAKEYQKKNNACKN